MKVFNIINCGTFDSKISFANLKESQKRKIQYFEIEYVISGNGISYIDDKSCKMIPGMILIRKPGNISYSKLHFKNNFLSLNIGKGNDYYDFLMNCPSFLNNINSKKYLSIYQSLINHVTQFGINSDNELITIDILKLLYNLKKDCIYNDDYSKSKKMSPTICAIINYLDENFKEKITLDNLAAKFGYSPFYLLKRFKETTGMSPNEYILEKRINLAKQEIILSNSTMAEIAYKCGFTSQAYFCYSFKKKVGISPIEYKKTVNNYYKL